MKKKQMYTGMLIAALAVSGPVTLYSTEPAAAEVTQEAAVSTTQEADSTVVSQGAGAISVTQMADADEVAGEAEVFYRHKDIDEMWSTGLSGEIADQLRSIEDCGRSPVVYLTGKATMKEKVAFMPGEDIIIDLEGHDLTIGEDYTFDGANLAIDDTVGGGTVYGLNHLHFKNGAQLVTYCKTEGGPEDTPTPTVEPDSRKAEANLEGRTLILKGKIGVTQYFTLSDRVAEDADAYAVFTVDGTETKVKVSEAEKTTNGKGQTSYGFSYYAAPRQMNDAINVRLYLGDGTPVVIYNGNHKKSYEDGLTYSVAQVAEVYADPSSGYNMYLQELAQNMLNYGMYAQKLLGYKADEVNPEDTMDEIDADTVEGYEPEIEGEIEGVKMKGMNLALRTDTDLYFYLTLPGGASAYKVTLDGKKVKPEKGGRMYQVKIPSIAAAKMYERHEIVVEKDGETMSFSVNVMSWVNLTLNHPERCDQKTLEMAKAVFKYGDSAHRYFDECVYD